MCHAVVYAECCRGTQAKFSAVRGEIECICTDHLEVGNQVKIWECIRGHYSYYLVFDVKAVLNFEEAVRVYHFCMNDLEASKEATCEPFKCLPGWSGSLCEIEVHGRNIKQKKAVEKMPSTLYIGCFKYVNCVERSYAANLDECINFCKQYPIYRLVICMRTPLRQFQNGSECFCSTEVDELLESSMCNSTCADGKACGGAHFYSVYSSSSSFLHNLNCQILVEDLVGCYSDEKINLEKAKDHFKDDYMTFAYCLSFCREHKSDHVALKNSSMCVCGYLFDLFAPSDQVHISKCDVLCRDDPTKNCGSTHAFSVYKAFSFYQSESVDTSSHFCMNNMQANFCHPGMCDDGWTGIFCNERDCSKSNGNCEDSTCISVTVNGHQRNECHSHEIKGANNWCNVELEIELEFTNIPMVTQAIYFYTLNRAIIRWGECLDLNNITGLKVVQKIRVCVRTTSR
ncbi:hypothetical protein HELRODRAFT_174126 [Helobdella robusta]|uniref:WSC domain-containing protein n=1 Tax=Helobdella robusta TaxID=6412 RepID=T1F7N6_HELRO|nr:hypothetical protein HELRODRAFT_174126 [Helobdella robusta]ESO03226.1 hypothetical protein HELRODRAFT_174126 [Helobdella robusta]